MVASNKPITDLHGQVLDFNKVKKYFVSTIQRSLEPTNLHLRELRKSVESNLQQLYAKSGLNLADEIRQQLFTQVLGELIGYGPIQFLLDDPSISEVMVNGHQAVYIERDGKVTKTEVQFENDEHVMRVIERIVSPLGRRLDSDHPAVDTRLPDGSRVNIIIPPVAIDGPAITIRKFNQEKLTIRELINLGTLTQEVAEFLRACVVSRLNVVISGGTGSGKTTLLNMLSTFIPEEERIVTIEDAAELQLQQEHVVRLETKQPTDNNPGMNIRDLVRNALRMRPERIIVGECRGGETLDMLQAMNTGHDGSLTTLHANSPRDAISRLETMTLMAGIELPIKVVREQIASAIDLVLQVSRMRDGSRKITHLSEVGGMEGDTVVLSDIFKFDQTSIDQDGTVIGTLKPTGIRPLFGQRLEAAGFKLKPEIFGANIAEILAANRRAAGRR